VEAKELLADAQSDLDVATTLWDKQEGRTPETERKVNMRLRFAAVRALIVIADRLSIRDLKVVVEKI
jgi:hypothetical protein